MLPPAPACSRLLALALAFLFTTFSGAQTLSLEVAGVPMPTAVTFWPGNDNLMVVGKSFPPAVQIHNLALPPSSPLSIPVLDLSGTCYQVTPGAICGDFRGITGLVFHPDFLTDPAKRFLYVRYNRNDPSAGSGQSRTRIEEYYIPPGVNQANPSPRIIFDTLDTSSVHVSGKIRFALNAPAGSTNVLLAGMPDGADAISSAAGSPCCDAAGAQDPMGNWGRVLAIDVDGAIPVVLSSRAIGLRNPWGFAIDRGDINGQGRGDIWIGDTGELITGSVLKVASSSSGIPNFGWPWFEAVDFNLPVGTGVYAPAACYTDGTCPGSQISPTMFEMTVRKEDLYGATTTTDRDAIIGGYVYRGSALPSFYGLYIFGTFGRAWPSGAYPPKAFAFDPASPASGLLPLLGTMIPGTTGIQGVPSAQNLVGIEENSQGEPFFLFANCGSSTGNGRIYKMVP